MVDLVVRIGNLVGAKVKRNDISTAHRLPPKRHSKIGDPPGIIARFKVRLDWTRSNQNLTSSTARKGCNRSQPSRAVAQQRLLAGCNKITY